MGVRGDEIKGLKEGEGRGKSVENILGKRQWRGMRG